MNSKNFFAQLAQYDQITHSEIPTSTRDRVSHVSMLLRAAVHATEKPDDFDAETKRQIGCKLARVQSKSLHDENLLDVFVYCIALHGILWNTARAYAVGQIIQMGLI